MSNTIISTIVQEAVKVLVDHWGLEISPDYPEIYQSFVDKGLTLEITDTGEKYDEGVKCTRLTLKWSLTNEEYGLKITDAEFTGGCETDINAKDVLYSIVMDYSSLGDDYLMNSAITRDGQTFAEKRIVMAYFEELGKIPEEVIQGIYEKHFEDY